MERAAASLLLCGLAALHVVYAFVFRVESDEPQHLHVVWGWTQGLLPYRDFFDNHAPLFSWLFAPLLRALGERADIIPWMRLGMIPLGGVTLLCLYRLGSCLFSRRAGFWAAAGAGFFPMFFYTSSEFRPDNLWTALWLLALTLLLTDRPTPRRLFFFGLVFGFCFATSLKTTLLAATLLLAGALAFAANWPRMTFPPASIRNAAAAAAGLTLAPGAFMTFFALQGAWKPFLYCLVIHNALPGMAESQGLLRLRPLLFPLALPGLLAGARTLLRRPGSDGDPWRVQRVIFLLAACGYPLLLVSFWPLLTRQDYLPATPPLALAIGAGLFALPRQLRHWQGKPVFHGACNPLLRTALPGVLILGEMAAIFCMHGPWRNRTLPERELLAATLRLTAPGDSVMDDKGETIFRRRPFYFALEGIARERLHRGLIADDIAERLVAARTAVVHAEFLPWKARAFVQANYLSVGALSVLGKTLEPAEQNPPALSRRYPFQIAVPARYVVMRAEGAPALGQLDDQPLDGGARWLSAGPHEFTAATGGRLIVFWADAWEKGFCPVQVSPVL